MKKIKKSYILRVKLIFNEGIKPMKLIVRLQYKNLGII